MLNEVSKKALAEVVLRINEDYISDEFFGKLVRVAIETLDYIQNEEGDKVTGETNEYADSITSIR